MKEELNLTDKQYDQILEIKNTHFKKLDKYRDENEPDLVMLDEFMKIKTERDENLEKVLTKDQFEKYQENNLKQRRKMMSKTH
jgi:Spy/CpxP family protein refolding chaperone